MMSKAKALDLAREIPLPQPGEIISAPIEVCCAFMELHGLKIQKWLSGYVVLVPDAVIVITDEEKKASSS